MKRALKLIFPLLFLILPGAAYYFIWLPRQPVIIKTAKTIKATASATHSDKPVVKKIKYLNRGNSRIIPLNERFSVLPFHPVKLKFLDNKIFYLDKGSLYSLEIKQKFATPVKIASNSKEFSGLAVHQDGIFLLDKLNNIYFYNPRTKALNIILKSKGTIIQPDPQFTDIFFQNGLYILDTARNQVFRLSNSQQLSSLFNILTMPLNPEARDLKQGIAIYRENITTYILKRPALIDVYNNSSFKKRILIKEDKKYGFLGFFSTPALKNLYLSGGYNGTITAVSKNSGELTGELIITVNQKRQPVFDLNIIDKTLYVLAGNYLLIHENFQEGDFEDIYLKSSREDLLFKAIDNEEIWGFTMPLQVTGINLPEHPSVFPGARRLYRYGIHEGIDFYTDKTSNIIVDEKTPVIAAHDGMIVRADHKYREMTVKEHDKVLAQCKLKNETSPEHADKLRGMQVRILHNGNLVTVYAHLSKISEKIQEGKYVSRGEIIGYVGNSGTTDGVYQNRKNLHLHFEVHIDDESADLEYYLGKYLTIEETMQVFKRIFH